MFLNSIVKKIVGIDYIIDYTLKRIGKLEKVYLVGKLAKGLDTDIIDMVLVGDINKAYLVDLIAKAEKKINKKIKFIVYSEREFDIEKIKESDVNPLLIWSK